MIKRVVPYSVREWTQPDQGENKGGKEMSKGGGIKSGKNRCSEYSEKMITQQLLHEKKRQTGVKQFGGIIGPKGDQ